MSQTMPTAFLPSSMEEKLTQISRRQAVISVLRAVAIGASVLFASMVVAMLIDWQLTLFSTGVRTALTITSLVLSVGAVMITGLPSLAAALKRVQAAMNADAEISQLEERWQTVVTVASSGRQPTSSTAKAMLQQVTSEAVAIGRVVQPSRVADPASLNTAVKGLAVCALSLAGFLAIDWRQTSILLRRFCAPTANISATSLDCPTGDISIARGEFVDLTAEMQGLHRKSAILTIGRPDSKPETVELAVDKMNPDRFVHRMQVDETFQYRVRAGDGQTAWYTVTVVDYPTLAEVRFTVIAPAYLNRPNVEKAIIPGRLKVMQGSLLQLQMRPKEPLQRLELTITPEVESQEKSPAKAQVFTLTADANGWYQFNTQLLENLSLTPQLWNSHGLTNEDRSVCRIQVIADNAPVARVLTPTDEMSVASDDVVEIKFEAHDDHGITKAELIVYDESLAEDGQPAPVLKVVPIPLGDQELAKHVVATTQLDLKQLNLKPGTQVSYAVRVTDNRTVTDERTTTSPRQTQSSEPNSSNHDSDGKTPDSRAVADSRSKEGTNQHSDESSKSSLNKAAEPMGDETADESAKNAGTTVDSDKAPGENVASSQTVPTNETPGDSKKGNTDSGDKAGRDEAKTSRTQPGKESALEGSNDVGNPSDLGDETTETKNSESGKTPLSDQKKGSTPTKEPKKDSSDIAADDSVRGAETPNDQPEKESLNSKTTKSAKDSAKTSKQPTTGGDDGTQTKTKSTDVDDAQSPDRANAPTAEAPQADSTDSKSRRAGTKSTDAKTGASNPEIAEPSAEGDSKTPPSEQDVYAADKRDPETRQSDPKTSNQNASDNKRNDDPSKVNDDETGNATKKSAEPDNSNVGQGKKSQKSNESEDGPPPPRMMTMAPQQSESGQNSETNRRRLKIIERLSALAEARESRKAETSNVRQQVVEIDAMLAEVETGLTRIVNREIPDDDQSAQYKSLDTQLGKVEGKISALRKETRDEQFAFVGLQMLDIGRSHVTPARERVFVAIREPASASSGNTRGALQQIVRARELLAALLKRYDRVVRDQQLAESLKDGVKMYEVYVEKMQQLMREARQNQNPLDRKMAVIEVGQDYLDRYAEVLTMRREMMAEFGRILGDDPRLLARYLDLVKRRRSSLREQLSELSKRQMETFTELSGWVAADAAQRDDLWSMAVELRMQASTQLAKDAAELAERIEKQFPLVLEATLPTPAKVIGLGRQIAEVSRGISLEAKRQIRQPDAEIDLRPKAEQLTQLFVELDAKLEQLNFENSKETEVTNYVTGRLLESRTVADQADLWRQTAEHVHGKRYHGLTEVDQHRIAVATELLRVDMLGIETELSAQFQQLAEKSIPEPIVGQIHELHQMMEEITFEQTGAEFAMSGNQLPSAEKLLKQASDNFARAEELFDRMRRAIVDALDELKVPNPAVADLEDPKLDEFLTQLEREPNIDAQLGIPERPRNLRVIADSMMWQQEGSNQLGAMEDEARTRMKEEKRDRKKENGPADSEKPVKEPDENQPTEEEREEQEQLRKTTDDLAKALLALRERAKDPSADPEELKKLEQAAREVQEKLEQMQQAMDPDKLWKPMKADLEKTLAMLKERTDDPSKPAVDAQRIEQLTKDLQRILDQMRKEPNAENRWKMVAEFERKKEVLKAVARGERIPDEQWNKLLSKLDDGLWQVGGRSLPEEYRKAIEQYQEQIRKLTNSGTEDDR